MKNIVAGWKTTLLGLIIIAAGIAYIFIVQDSKVFQFAILLVVGIGFLFAPDTIVDGLRSLIQNNKTKNSNMEAILTRDLNQDKQTLGSLVLKDSEGNKLFVCKTLELPWLENKNNKSCIPVGNYNVVTRKSARYGTHFHVTDVPNRTFILLHAGNTYNDTRGCILLGSKLVDINGDDYKDVANSLATIKNLIKLAPNGFCLEVKNKVKRNAKI